MLRILALLLIVVALLEARTAADAAFENAMRLAREGKTEEAAAIFESGLISWPSDKRFPEELAGLEWRKKRADRAVRLLRRTLALDPADAYARQFLGTLYASQGNVAAALKHWNRVKMPLVQNVRELPELPLDPVLDRRTFAMSGGQILTEDQILATEANLRRLNFLASWRWTVAPRRDGRYDVLFQSVPVSSPVTGWLGRLLPLVRGLPYQSLYFDRYNIGKRAVHVNTLLRWDTDKRRLALEVGSPFRLDPRVKLSFLADARGERWTLPGIPDNVHVRRYEAGGVFDVALRGSRQWSSALLVSRRQFEGGDSSGTFRDGWSLQWPNRFSSVLWTAPEQRVRVEGDVLVSPGRSISSESSQFLVLQGNASAEWFPQATGDRWKVTSRASAGHVAGTVALDQLFQPGLERDNSLTLRGHVGTRDGRKGSSPMGKDYALLATDVSRRVLSRTVLRIDAGPFFDTAWIHSRFGPSGWLYDAGVQAKLTSLGGVSWTFTYGRNLRDGGGVFYVAASRSFRSLVP